MRSISASTCGRQPGAPGVEVLVQLRERGHADDRAGHLPFRVAPRQRHPGRRHAMVARELVVAARRGQRLGAAPALLAHRLVAARCGPSGASGPSNPDLVVLAGEQPERQRRIRQQRHAQPVHRLVQAVLQARLTRQYAFCTVAIRGRPCCSASRTNSCTPYGVSFDRPMWRTLPSLTSRAERFELLLDRGRANAPGTGRSTAGRTRARGAPASGSGTGRSRRSSAAAASPRTNRRCPAAVRPQPVRIHGIPREGPADLGRQHDLVAARPGAWPASCR